MDNEQEIKTILQKACDRDWKDETLYQTAVIASNAIYWRDREIELLKKKPNGVLSFLKVCVDQSLPDGVVEVRAKGGRLLGRIVNVVLADHSPSGDEERK